MGLKFYSVKLLNLFYVGMFYFLLGTIVASFVTYMTPTRSKEELEKLGTVHLYSETIILSSILFIMIYLCRKVMKTIGSPFHNIAGFDFYRLKEINGGIVLSLSLILFSPKLISITRVLGERFNKPKDSNKNKLTISGIVKEEYKLLMIIIIILLLLISLYMYRKYTGGFEIKQNNNLKTNNKLKTNKKSANGNTIALNSGNNSGSDGGI